MGLPAAGMVALLSWVRRARSFTKPQQIRYVYFQPLASISLLYALPSNRRVSNVVDRVTSASQHSQPLLGIVELAQSIFRHGSRLPSWYVSRHELEPTLDTPDDFRLGQSSPALQRLIRALRCGDIRSALVQAQQNGLFVDPRLWADVNPRLFSAVLMGLDPLHAGPLLDPAHGVDVPPSVAAEYAFQGLFERSGSRSIFVFLFRIVQWIFAVRIASGSLPARSDWTLLMRLAGTTGDRTVARRIWSATAMVQRGYGIDVRHSENYAEYIRSRFLTSPLYTSFKPYGGHVTIFDIGYKSNVKLKIAKRNLLAASRLRRAWRKLQLKPRSNLQDALNSGDVAYGAEWFTSFFAAVQARGVVASEDLICSVMLAFATQGSLVMIRRLLALAWDIRVHSNKETGNVTITGGRTFPCGHPLSPTNVLIDAIVLAFGSNAEIQTCVKLADFVSQRYAIQISPEAWSSMLAWTHAAASWRVAWEWEQAGFHEKRVNPEATQMLWDTMRSDPYKIKPSFSDYDVIIKYLSAKGNLSDAIARLYDAKEKFWEPHESEFFDTEAKYALAMQSNSSSDGQAYCYERASLLRSVMHRKIGTWICGIASHAVAEGDSDDIIVRHLPAMLRDFEHFIRFPVRYRTYNGTVYLQDTTSSRIPRRQMHVAARLDRFCKRMPCNFTSKRWWQHLQSHKARYSEYNYPSATYGPRRRALGRPLLRRGRGDMAVTYYSWHVTPGGHRVMKRKKSNSWSTVDLHYERPTNVVTPNAAPVTLKDNNQGSYLRAKPSPPPTAVPPQLRSRFKKNSLFFSRTAPKSQRQDAGISSARDVLIELGKRNGKISRGSAFESWKMIFMSNYLAGLSPDIGDHEVWKWAMKGWPNLLSKGLRRLRRARKVRVFVDGRRATTDMLDKFPLEEAIAIDKETGSYTLVPKRHQDGPLSEGKASIPA